MLSGDVVSGLFPVGKVASCLAITRDVITQKKSLLFSQKRGSHLVKHLKHEKN